MEAKRDHVILRVAKYGYENQQFTLNDLIGKGVITEDEREYIRLLIDYAHGNTSPNIIATVSGRQGLHGNAYTLLPSTVFSYADHLELKFAQENAREARRYSIWAIALSAVAVIIAAIDLIATLF